MPSFLDTYTHSHILREVSSLRGDRWNMVSIFQTLLSWRVFHCPSEGLMLIN